MRWLMMGAVTLSFAFPLALPAEAQTRLPRTSPAERQVQDINRSLRQEQRQLRLEQQIQIDRNQLQRQIDRQRLFSNPTPPARIGTCPPGSVAC
ncbi:hypothetical protein [Microvirga roseola]|uniref:hypothetical protein n=1 Tax=Microvirga roseola TaxID=2883126 RepID=UPI001E34DC23|nr:hypothetical protein [Microvirga roseola]